MTHLVVSPSFLRLSDVIRTLRSAVAAWGGRGDLAEALVLLVYRRLGEIGLRMARMAERFQAGRVWRRTGRAGRVAGSARGRAVRVWPGRFGWLVREVGWEAAGFGAQLRAVLETEEMQALLQASPQAMRVLRPLCRALAIETQVLRPGVVVRVRGGSVGGGRVRARRLVLDTGRVKVPRGVMSAVRRGRFLGGG